MKLKRVFGLCECPGCKRFATTAVLLKVKGKFREVNVCDECSEKLRSNLRFIEFR